MRDIPTNRTITSQDAIPALDAALKAALPSVYSGLTTRKAGAIYVLLQDAATELDVNTAIQLVLNHDMATRTPEQLGAVEDAARKTAAKTTAAAIPSWATFTEAQALAWLDGHVSSTQVSAISSLAEAKAVLADMATLNRALVRLVVALRDHTWPELPREV